MVTTWVGLVAVTCLWRDLTLSPMVAPQTSAAGFCAMGGTLLVSFASHFAVLLPGGHSTGRLAVIKMFVVVLLAGGLPTG